jgi:glutathione S-transferase
VPLLLVNDGEAAVAQSGAILRYVCTLGGLHPSDALAAAAVDAALAQETDAFASVVAIKYRDRSGLACMDEACLAQAERNINAEVLPRHLAALEALLAASKSGWITGTDRPAACDFAWGTQLHAVRSGVMPPVQPSVLDAFPRCVALVDKLLALPEAKAYYKL